MIRSSWQWRALAIASVLFGGKVAIAAVPAISAPYFPEIPFADYQVIPPAVVGYDFRYQIVAGGSPTSYGADGLPPGLHVDSATGVITGAPTGAGDFPITLSATNADGTGTANVSLNVKPAPTAAPVLQSIPDHDTVLSGDENAPLSPGDSLGSDWRNHTAYFTITASNYPSSYAASGLPANAVLSSTLGFVSYQYNDLPVGRYPVTVTATNPVGSDTTSFTWTVHPAIVGAILTDGGSFVPGDDITFVVNFNAPVVVSGAPYLSIRHGAAQANYSSGSGTTRLKFKYHMPATDSPFSESTPDTVQLNGGTITTTDGIPAKLVVTQWHSPVYAIYAVLDPTQVTPMTNFTGPAAGTYHTGDVLRFQTEYSVPITVRTNPSDGTPAVQFTIGSGPRAAGYVSGSGTNVLTFEYVVTATDAGAVVVARDLDNYRAELISSNLHISGQHAPPDTSGVVIGGAAGGNTPQTITFASPTGAVRVGQPITLGALSSAGLPITYAVVSGDATIAGNVLTPTSTATLIVRASSPGDATYAAASTDVNFGNPIPVGDSRLVNISSRVRVSAGDAGGATVAGFYVTGTTPKQILIRAAGPSLTQFGITNPVTNPQLTLYDNKNAVIATNAGWKDDASIAAAGKAVSAFALNPNSTDSALLMTLSPGLYTAQVQSGNTGTVLIEVYDVGSADPNPTKQLINISTRGYVGVNEDALVAGFVVSGDAPKRMLIRGVGPGITQFGVSNVVGDPMLKVYDAKQVVVAQNDNWEAPQTVGANDMPATAAQITAADTAAGAFPLAAGSTDSAVIVTLNPGQYTAIVSGANGGTGNAIVEVYELP
jgi:hypothetical protein